MLRKNIHKFGKMLMLLLLLVGLPTLASADDGAKHREEVRSYQNRADMLKQADAKQYATELTKVSGWIEEALVLIGKEEFGKVKVLNERIGLYLRYIEVGLERDATVAKAKHTKEKLDKLKAAQGKLSAEIQQLKAREVKLQEQMKKAKSK